MTQPKPLIPFKVTIDEMPQVGPCVVEGQAVFPSGAKFVLRDSEGRLWHKREEEITVTEERVDTDVS